VEKIKSEKYSTIMKIDRFGNMLLMTDGKARAYMLGSRSVPTFLLGAANEFN
jgi:hypothetical protein